MALQKLIEKKIARLDEIPNEFIKSVGESQKQIWEELLALLDQLERKGGEIVINVKNVNLIDEIMIDLQKVVAGSDYVEAVKEFSKEFDQQATLNEAIIKESFDSVDVTKLSETILKNAKRNSVDLFVGGALDKEFYNPIRQVLTNSVNTGSSVKDTLKNIRALVEGQAGELGRLERYAKQITHDTFAVADATYAKTLADEMDAEYFKYVGGTITDTRQFCKEHNGKIYSKKEIESWADETWEGKYKGTDESTIFIYRGGYNCRHYFIAVPQNMVKT